MSKLRIQTAIAIVLASIGASPLFAQDGANGRPLLQRVPSYTAWYYDGRDDPRDFPTNGFFPGDFAANPSGAAIGATGIFGFTPYRAAAQPVDESRSDRTACAQRYRSYNAASGSFVGHDGARHRCR
jgi:hypothetical protein